MKRIAITAITAIALTGGMATSAEASSIRECGSGYWPYATPKPISNVTTRNVTCSTALMVAYRTGFLGHGRYTMRIGSYRCRVRPIGGWWLDIRCTYGARVIRWQYHSGE